MCVCVYVYVYVYTHTHIYRSWANKIDYRCPSCVKLKQLLFCYFITIILCICLNLKLIKLNEKIPLIHLERLLYTKYEMPIINIVRTLLSMCSLNIIEVIIDLFCTLWTWSRAQCPYSWRSKCLMIHSINFFNRHHSKIVKCPSHPYNKPQNTKS